MLSRDESKKRQERLNKFLQNLAKTVECNFDDDDRVNNLVKLSNIYSDGFRHFYSEISSVVGKMEKEQQDFLESSLEDFLFYLENKNNIEELKKKKIDVDSLSRSMYKLIDHIHLECSRKRDIDKYNDMINDASNRANEINKSINDIKKTISSTETNIKDLKKKTDDSEKKVKDISIDIITILSIYSAIVLAFSGGISYISGALSGMASVSIYKASFLVLLCGFVIFNLIFVMLYVVSKITDKSIYTSCKSKDCQNCEKECCIITRIKNRMPYVFWTDVLIVLLMAVDVLACKF